MSYIDAFAIGDIPDGEARVLHHPGGDIGVFNVDGEFLAVDDLCSHATSSLAEEGFVEGDVVECGAHFARFCLRTGAALCHPAPQPIRTYETTVVEGRVMVALPDSEP